MAGILDSIASGAASLVDAGTAEVRSLIQRFGRASAAAEANYAKLLAHNEWRKTTKTFFKTEAERAKFQALLDEGRLVVNQMRTAKVPLVAALKAVNLKPADYGLAVLPALIIPGAVAYAVYKAVGVAESWTKKSDPAVTVGALVASGISPADAVKLNAEALNAQANANKGTLDRILDNLPLLVGGTVAVWAAPKVIEVFRAMKAR